MIRTMDGASELWRMRKQFALQVASTSFLTYMLFLSNRYPLRFFVSRSTGQIVMTEPLPSMLYLVSYGALRLIPSEAFVNPSVPVFHVNDVVPFRLTPNMQHFIAPIFFEGILAPGIMSIGRSLTDPQVSSLITSW